MTKRQAAVDRDALLALRRQVRFQDGRPYDARCSTVTAAIEARFGFPRQSGRLRLLDGTILDATADQFETDWVGDIVVLGPDDPLAAAYQPSPPAWTFSLRGHAPVLELAAVPDGSGMCESARCKDWFEAARRVLRTMTGWEIPDDLVDCVARILWVRTASAQSTTSGQLDDLLTMYEWAHRAVQRGKPWLAPEYEVSGLSAEANAAPDLQSSEEVSAPI